MGDFMKINFKKLFIFILATFLLGNLFTIFSMNTEFYKSLEKPFNLPSIVFPIVWSILFILMSISLYIVSESKKNETKSYILYFVQLFVNSLWTLFFFKFKLFLFSFVWIFVILFFVILMMINFYKINKTAAYLQIPYVLWLIFASILNYSIYYLN